MKKLLILLMAAMFLVACSSKTSAVSNGEFTFTEDEFKEAYEKTNDRNIPKNISAYDTMLRIEFADKEEVLRFLKAANQITGYKEIDRLRKSIDEDESNIQNVISNDDISIVYDDRFDDEYAITIYPEGDKFGKEDK